MTVSTSGGGRAKLSLQATPLGDWGELTFALVEHLRSLDDDEDRSEFWRTWCDRYAGHLREIGQDDLEIAGNLGAMSGYVYKLLGQIALAGGRTGRA